MGHQTYFHNKKNFVYFHFHIKPLAYSAKFVWNYIEEELFSAEMVFYLSCQQNHISQQNTNMTEDLFHRDTVSLIRIYLSESLRMYLQANFKKNVDMVSRAH